MRKKFCILMAVLLVFLAGCDLSLDDEAIHAETVAVLDAIVANDYEAVRARLSRRIMDTAVQESLEALHGEFAELGEYRMTAIGRQEKTENGASWTAIRYLVTAGERQFSIDVTKIDGETGLSGFKVHSFSQDVPVAEPKGLLHWGFTILGVAAGVFALWALADCLRRKPKHRWVYVLMILLLSGLLTVTLSDGSFAFKINFGIHLGLSSLETYATGDFAARVYFPLGALIYCLLRKKLTKPEAAEHSDKTQVEEEPATEP